MKLLDILVDLPIFRSMKSKHIKKLFENSFVRRSKKGETEYFTAGTGIVVILRGSLRIGKKISIGLDDIKSDIALVDLDINPSIEHGVPKNVFFDLTDGDYISKNIFNFFPLVGL